MEEKRINIKRTKKRKWSLIIGIILFSGPIILNLILLITGKRNLIGLGFFSWLAGCIIFFLEISELRRTPTSILLTGRGIKFNHWMGISKSPKFVKWSDIIEIWPSNYIELKNGKKIMINFLIPKKFDLVIEFLAPLNLRYLIKGKIGDNVNLRTEGPAPDISYTAVEKKTDYLLLWIIVSFLLTVLALGALVTSIYGMILGKWLGALFASLFACGMTIMAILSIRNILGPIRSLIVRVSPEGIKIQEKGRLKHDLRWTDIEMIEDYTRTAGEFYTIGVKITMKNGDKKSFNNEILTPRSQRDLIIAMSKYCFYYGIPIDDSVGYLDKELKRIKGSS
jgi:hypothetical protein